MRTTTLPTLTMVTMLGLTVAGCGANVEPSANAAATTRIENCGRTIDYPVPQRAVAYDMSAIEKVFALGLADRLAGIVLPSTADEPAARSPWKQQYDSANILGTDVLSRETVVDAKSDWVLAGWNSGFSEARGITPKLLDEVGIRSYMFTESCFNYGDKPVKVPPLEALYTDLRQIGQIFQVPDKAEALIGDLRARADALAARKPQGDPARVFVYDSGTDQPSTSGGQGAPDAMIGLAGGRNVFHDLEKRWTSVGWEAVAATQPEVISVVDYGDQPVADKIAFLKSFPALAQTPAVRENRFHILDYGVAVSGPRNIDGAEQLSGYLRSIGH